MLSDRRRPCCSLYGVRNIRPRQADTAQPWLHERKAVTFLLRTSPLFVRHGIGEGKGTFDFFSLSGVAHPESSHLFEYRAPILRVPQLCFDHTKPPTGNDGHTLPRRYAARILIPGQDSERLVHRLRSMSTQNHSRQIESLMQNAVGYGLFSDVRHRQDAGNIPAVRRLHQIHFNAVRNCPFVFPRQLSQSIHTVFSGIPWFGISL